MLIILIVRVHLAEDLQRRRHNWASKLMDFSHVTWTLTATFFHDPIQESELWSWIFFQHDIRSNSFSHPPWPYNRDREGMVTEPIKLPFSCVNNPGQAEDQEASVPNIGISSSLQTSTAWFVHFPGSKRIAVWAAESCCLTLFLLSAWTLIKSQQTFLWVQGKGDKKGGRPSSNSNLITSKTKQFCKKIKMESWVQSWRRRANACCVFFVPSVESIAHATKVRPVHTKRCTCHAKSS